ncbi:hypothetical protein [Thiocapsa roseopersicina]|uniref:Uncharacterized protein n=1 Tax=Thiocapsa roseopersicina TaxID=1058 RepID=A0A1H2X5Y0_THIRO|nr:hypothetical protein [Thiocapsa roseopersicina]SDW87679.1 hypothetical protein SAMN05421783_1109 [Thiocapsa roseopersicina]
MKGDQVPDADHVARYCGGASIHEDGRVDGSVFRLRKFDGKPEPYLSVNWLEYLEPSDRSKQLDALRTAFQQKPSFKVRSSARFAVHNVGALRGYVRTNSPDQCELSVLHEPDLDDDSHCGVYGLPMDDDLVADLIADIVQATYPAKAG